MASKALSLSSSSLRPFPAKPLCLRRSLRSDCFSKTSFSLYVNNGIDRCYNPDRRRTFNHPKIVRRWIQSDSPPPSFSSQERFMVVSYNILADRNASKHRGFYSDVPSEFMNWDYRKRVLCEELIGLNPDIICLQEVDKYYDLLAIMEKEGYVGTYKGRTGDTVDGCAMFWKSDLFNLLDGESIEFKEHGLRDNVAQLSVFQMCKTNSRRVVVGNIHVLFNQTRGDIKLGQIRLLLLRAQTLSEKWGNIPVVLAGDFNCTPQSAVYKFLSSSELNITLYDRRDLSGQRSCHPTQFSSGERQISKPCILMDRLFEYCWTDEEVKNATGNSSNTVVAHPLKLSSSYATVKGSTNTRDSLGEPSATSYHSSFLGTVDYLWYSDNLVPTRVLDTPSIDLLRKTGGLPNKKLGSDHLALGSEFTFTQCNKDNEHGRRTTTTTAVNLVL